MPKPSSLREHDRIPLGAAVRLIWEDDRGVRREGRAECIDIAERGLGLLCDDPIPLRSYVHFRIEKVGLSGSASVRYVGRKGLKHHIGLEFSGMFRWQGPPAGSKATASKG